MASFSSILADVTKQGTKLQTSEYLGNGKYPIIDQGQDAVAGYTDREDGLFTDVPVIVFGDHTRIVKYVVTPFFLGADGVKVLKGIREDTDSHYLYYAVSSIRIPNTGYNRHFKWLKEADIFIPDIPTQRRIAATLDKVSEGIVLCKQMMADLDELVKSQFVEMFGRPEDWSDELEYLGDHIDLINGFAFLSENFSEDGIPVIKIRNVNTADFSRGNMQYHPYDPSLKKYIVEPGDLLISLTGTVGKEDFANVCLADNTYDTYYLNQRNAKLVPHEELTKEFLLHFLKYDYIKRKLIKQGTGVRQCHLHNKDINEIQLIIPSKDKQSEFAKVTHQSYKSKFALQQQLAELETLKKSLMQKYFG